MAIGHTIVVVAAVALLSAPAMAPPVPRASGEGTPRVGTGNGYPAPATPSVPGLHTRHPAEVARLHARL